MPTTFDPMIAEEGDEFFNIRVRIPGDYIRQCKEDGVASDRETLREWLRNTFQEGVCDEQGVTCFFDVNNDAR